MTEIRMVNAPNVRDLARHVVKFADGTYLPHNLRYESRVKQQKFAHRWLTWSSAKTIADSALFKGTGAHAVHLRKKEVKASQFVCDGTCAGNELGDCNHGESNDGLQGKAHHEKEVNLYKLLTEARNCLVLATGQEGRDGLGDGLFTLGRMNDERRAVLLFDRIGALVRTIDPVLRNWNGS